jgi:LacI family transcriptional regulator
VPFLSVCTCKLLYALSKNETKLGVLKEKDTMTIKEIARLANTSRGTVDRVINKRGKVSEEVEQRVLKIIQDTGYIPNENGKLLSLSNKKILISIIIGSLNNTFFNSILEGIKHALATKYRYSGIDIELFPVKLFDDKSLMDALNSINKKSRLLIISTSGNEQIVQKINSLNIPVIAVSLDVNVRRKVGFVGCNFYNSGALAADVLNLIVKPEDQVAVFIGSYSHPGHSERLMGFNTSVRKDIAVATPIETFDDDSVAYERTKKLISLSHPDILVFFGGGMIGGLKAIREADYGPKVITVDEIPEVMEGLKTGLVSASVSQHPFDQGLACMDIAYDCLIKKETQEKTIRINCSVILKDSVLSYGS